MASPFYITTPIYYVNARPHLGHAYTTIVADVVRRFHTMSSDRTYFLTGTDEHGDKIVRAAKKEEPHAREYVDRISGLFRDLWPELKSATTISSAPRIRRTSPWSNHPAAHLRRGDIYFSEYEGLYCFGCERFYTERELVDGKCPDHERPPETIKESNYFFKMSKYQQWLIDHIKENPDFIRPNATATRSWPSCANRWTTCAYRGPRAASMGHHPALRQRLRHLRLVRRPAQYISALGYPDGERYKTFWPGPSTSWPRTSSNPTASTGRSCSRPPASRLPAPERSRLLERGSEQDVQKHRQCRGTAGNEKRLRPGRLPLLSDARHGLRPRFQFFRRSPGPADQCRPGQRSGQSLLPGGLHGPQIFRRRGSRTRSRCGKRDGSGAGSQCPDAAIDWPIRPPWTKFAFHKGLAGRLGVHHPHEQICGCHRPLGTGQKQGAEKTAGDGHLQPAGRAAHHLRTDLSGDARYGRHHAGTPGALSGDDDFYKLDRLASWRRNAPGWTTAPNRLPSFPRIDLDEKRSTISDQGKADRRKSMDKRPSNRKLRIDDFAKIDLRVATVVSAQAVPRARKLLQLEVDLGERRTIVSGIAGRYTLPKTLVGKQVIVVANLKPAKLMGVLSKGMLIAATDADGVTVATLDRTVAPGTPLS
jgi:methionyl-tRNA synthetase